MVRVVETELAPRLLELLRCDALQRSLRGHGHEYGERDWSMGKMERCDTGFGDLGYQIIERYMI